MFCCVAREAMPPDAFRRRSKSPFPCWPTGGLLLDILGGTPLPSKGNMRVKAVDSWTHAKLFGRGGVDVWGNFDAGVSAVLGTQGHSTPDPLFSKEVLAKTVVVVPPQVQKDNIRGCNALVTGPCNSR